ncbi:MAG: hypothetical protein WCJ87_06985 [Burkholderiales bacterium]
MSTLATPEGLVPEILEEILGFVRSPSGDTLSAELDGISFLAGEVPGAWTLRAWWYYGRTAGSDERILPARMPAIALEAEVFNIWRLANPSTKVPALLAAGADYVAWKAARARMQARSLRLCVDGRSLRIVCRKLCGEWFGPPRPGDITLTSAADRLIVTYRGQSVRIPAMGTWIGSVSLNANAFCLLVERRRRRAYRVMSFEDGRLSIDGYREPGLWMDDEDGD